MMNINRRLLLVCLTSSLFYLGSECVFANDFYNQHAVGWHWYDDPVETPKQKEQKTLAVSSDPNVIVKTAREKVTTALNKAIADPTIDNVQQYIALQEQLTNRAEEFSEVWQEALLKNAGLNYSMTHPTNNVALEVYNENQASEKEAAVIAFAKESGLFFFYRSTCPYCHRFAPILKNFAAHYGITVIPITLDGISIPEFPNSKVDTGQASQFQVTVTPSLFAVNPQTKKAYPVAYGLTSETELRDNIYKIMTRYSEVKG